MKGIGTSGQNLSGQNLSGQDLSGQDLSGRFQRPREKGDAGTSGREASQSGADPRRNAFGHRSGTGGGLGASRDGRPAPFAPVDDRGAPFRRLIEARTSDGDGRSGAFERGREDADRVLAVVEAPVEAPVAGDPAPMPMHGPAEAFVPVQAAVPPAASGPAPATPDGGLRMVALAERVEEALRLDRFAQVQGGGSFRLVGEAAGGLESITVVLTPTQLDVTLSHAFDGRPEDIAQAAALLAGQLQGRFATRRVRILQAAATDRAADLPTDGLARIGRLLGPPSR